MENGSPAPNPNGASNMNGNSHNDDEQTLQIGLYPSQIREFLQQLLHIANHLRPETVISAETSTVIRDSLNAVDAILQLHNAMSRPVSETVAQEPAPVNNEGNPISDLSSEIDSLILLERLRNINNDFQILRMESRHAHERLQEAWELLIQQNQELHYQRGLSDSDAAVELETLQDRVRDLEDWLCQWRRQHDRSSEQSNIPPRHRSPSDYIRQLELLEDQLEAFLNGVDAWIQGWKEVDEVFRARAMQRRRTAEGRGSIN